MCDIVPILYAVLGCGCAVMKSVGILDLFSGVN